MPRLKTIAIHYLTTSPPHHSPVTTHQFTNSTPFAKHSPGFPTLGFQNENDEKDPGNGKCPCRYHDPARRRSVSEPPGASQGKHAAGGCFANQAVLEKFEKHPKSFFCRRFRSQHDPRTGHAGRSHRLHRRDREDELGGAFVRI